jgi:hypothetical protein
MLYNYSSRYRQRYLIVAIDSVFKYTDEDSRVGLQCDIFPIYGIVDAVYRLFLVTAIVCCDLPLYFVGASV